MRVLVLAIDCLDYRLVNRFGLDAFKQRVWGTIDVSEFRKYKLLTPVIWTSFITGKPPEEHGVLHWWTWGRLLDRIRYYPPFKWVRGKRRILEKLGFKPRLVDRSHIKSSTIFDVVKPSIPLFVPAYNDPEWYHREYNRALRSSVKELEEAVLKVHKMKLDALMESLSREWKLLMVWFDVIDLFSHMYYPHRLGKIEWIYRLVALQVRKIAKHTPPDTLILIVSDHGIDENGLHYPKAFWSLNKEVGWRPNKITDFYKLILELYRSG